MSRVKPFKGHDQSDETYAATPTPKNRSKRKSISYVIHHVEIVAAPVFLVFIGTLVSCGIDVLR